jgi:predicted HicB family RNase H-like nuclease
MKRAKKSQAKGEVKPFNARLPKEIHTQAMVFRAKTGMSLQDQVLAGLRLLYAKRQPQEE